MNPSAHPVWAQNMRTVSSNSTTYSQLLRSGSHPAGLESHLAQFAETAGSRDFPCVFAPLA